MEYYENYDEAFIDEFDPYFGDESYADFEYFDGDESYGEDERRRLRRRRPRGRKNHVIISLQSQIRYLKRQLRQSKQGGATGTAMQRLTALEDQLKGMQQTQLFSSLLNIPQIESITFEGEKGTQAVEQTTYDQSTTLLLSLLGGNGLTGGSGKGGLDIKTFLLLSLIGNGSRGGLTGGSSSLLLLLLLLGDKK